MYRIFFPLAALCFASSFSAQTYALPKKQSATGSLGRGTLAITAAPAVPQNSNEVIDKESGIRFTPPQGWMAQKTAAGYLLVSKTEKGIIVMADNKARSLEQMHTEAQQGLVDENGTNLQLAGEIVAFGDKGLGAPYQGVVEGQPVKAYAVGLLSPFGGGVSIIAMAEKVHYSEHYAEYPKAIARGMIFFKPEIPPLAEQWKRDLCGAKLTYLWSYSSRGYSDGSYTGGSHQIEIHLCPQGFFKYYDSSQSSIDGGHTAGFGFGSGKDLGQGTWDVTANGPTPVLVLQFQDGRIMKYDITYENKKLFLDGKRYFWTTADSEFADQRLDCQ